MKSLVLFVIFFLIGCFGMLLFLHYSNVSIPTPIKKTAFSLEKAPSQSLVATMVSLSGDVDWISRIATQPAKLTIVKNLQQGEEIDTGKNGSATIAFVKKAQLTLSANTKLALVQTLPIDIVVSQTSGTVVYAKKDTKPFSVRSEDILINIPTGTTDVYVDTKNKQIVATVHTGSITAAYTDADNVSQVLSAKQGQQLIFDDDTLSAVVN